MPKETTATYPCPHQQYYPWGEEKFGSSPNDRVKFATYRRDSESLLDYAWNRYYDNTTGRFLTPDSYKGSADPYNPQSWNRYGYGLGDPVGNSDVTGLLAPTPGGLPCAPWDASCSLGDGWGVGDYIVGWGFVFLGGGGGGGGRGGGGGGCGPNCAKPLPPPQCSVSLYERPVPVGRSPGWHTYLVLTATIPGTDLVVTDDVEGGPVPKGDWWSGGLLTGTIAPPGLGLNQENPSDATDPTLPSNVEIGHPYTGLFACYDAGVVETDVLAYNAGSRVKYNALAKPGTYNSNSFTFTLLYQIGLASYFGQPGNLAPGWGKLVPGL